ncbi:solute carrier organic anion transporter family member 1B1-like isoform X1, partial [Argonauta hians]
MESPTEMDEKKNNFVLGNTTGDHDILLSDYKIIRENKENGGRRTNTDEDTDTDIQCGIGSFRPACLQPLNNMCSFILFSLGSILVSSTLSPYLVSQVTTLERQFSFSSVSSGFLLACNDIGFSIVVLLVSHICRNGHVPRILAISTFIFGLGGLLCALPYFLDVPEDITPEYNVSSWKTTFSTDRRNLTDESYMCKQQETNTGIDQHVKKRSNVLALSLLSIGMVLQGMAKSVRRPMTTSYIDNNVKKTNTGKYIGIVTAIGIFGPVVGFAVGTVATKTYYDLQEFFTSLRRIIKNASCSLLLIGGALDMMTSAGLFSFMAKYMETQYLYSAWKSNLILGTTTLVALSIGTLSGGIITSKAKLQARGCLAFIAVCFVLSSIFNMACLMVGCDFPEMVGPELLPSGITQINGTVLPECKESCSCDDAKYLPVCSEGGTNYYSPCYAGCKEKNGT